MPHSGIDTSAARLEGKTLVIRIPLHFQRHGGRKLIVGPDGEENWAPLPTPDRPLANRFANELIRTNWDGTGRLGT